MRRSNARGVDMKRERVAAVLICGAASVLGAANWVGDSGNYTNQTMWSTGVVPGDYELVYFSKSGSYTVTVDGVVTNGYAEFNGAGSAYGVTLALDAGDTFVVRTNLVVKGGSVAKPTRAAVNGGKVEVLVSGNGAGGLIGQNGELYLTNTVLSVASGGYFYVGCGVSNNVFVVGSGSCYTGAQVVVGDQGASCCNRLEVSGSGAQIAVPGAQIRLGLSGCGNAMVVTNGGLVKLGYFGLGTNPTGNSNRLNCVNADFMIASSGSQTLFGGKGSYNLATFGAGGRLTASGGANLTVGGDTGGSFNRLRFSDGALATNANPFCIGNTTSSTNNIVEVTGAGTAFVNTNGSVLVGVAGLTNALVVSDGASFVSTKGDLICGQNATAIGNYMVASGSVVVVSNALYTGLSGSYNAVAFTNSTLYVGGGFYVGSAAGTGNVFRAGTGTVVISYSPFIVANNAACRADEAYFEDAVGVFGNSGGAAASINPSCIGANGHANRLYIRGATGRLVNTNAYFYVGYYGSYNQMVIENGGRLQCSGLLIGDQSGLSNSAAISGAGSRIDSSGYDIRIGAGSSTGSVMVVSNGAVIDSGTAGFGVNYATNTWGATLLVSNAVVFCTNNTFFTHNDAVVSFAGTNSQLTARNCAFNESPTLSFAIPRAGRSSTNAVIRIADSLTLVSPSLRIAAQEWARHAGGRITLLTYNGALTGDLAALAASAQLDSPLLSVAVVGKSLVLSAPRYGGTVICID